MPVSVHIQYEWHLAIQELQNLTSHQDKLCHQGVVVNVVTKTAHGIFKSSLGASAINLVTETADGILNLPWGFCVYVQINTYFINVWVHIINRTTENTRPVKMQSADL